MEDLFSLYGQVKAPLRVSSEMRQIDIWFEPQVSPSDLQPLGLLGRMAQTTAILEPFRNPATPEEICGCLLKALELRAEQQRQAERSKNKPFPATLPTLWVLTPTASVPLLKGFRAQEEDTWPPGLYFLADTLKTTIVAIHQLPQTPETLWLRLLGRGRVQAQAIDELEALPANNPFRSKALELVLNLQQNLKARQDKDRDDREIIMRLAPLWSQEKEQIRQECMQQGIQQGIQQGTQGTQRTILEALLRSRFGTLDADLETVVNAMLALSPESFAASIPQCTTLSREDLLAWLPTASNQASKRLSPLYSQEKEQIRQEGIEQGIQQGIKQGIQQGTQGTQRIVVETLLKSRFGAIDPELERVVNAMEVLSSEAFAASLPQLNILSREDLLAQFPTTH